MLKQILTFTLVLLSASTALAQMNVSQRVGQIYDDQLEELFLWFHQNPELSYMEHETAARLAGELESLGYDVHTGVGGTGLVALLTNGEGPTVMLRADMDGLPVQEKSGLPYASKAKQVDWDGNVVWKFSKYDRVKDGRQKAKWVARQHHDYQREGNPVGYYAPGMDPIVGGGSTLVLCHKDVAHKGISEKPILDDTFVEVSWDGKITWEWLCSDHFDELGFEYSK